MNQLTTIFVYGTLRNSASNDWRLEDATWLGQATVAGRLYRIDWYPGLILDRSAPRVIGEVYEVDQETLEELDDFEGTTEYRRVITEVKLSDGTSIQAHLWEYIGPVDTHSHVPSGDWFDVKIP